MSRHRSVPAAVPATLAALAAAAACSSRPRDAGPTAVAPDEPAGSAAQRPARQPRPLDDTLLDDLEEVTVAGRQVAVTRRGPLDLAATVTGPGVGDRVTVMISACLACVPMELSAWQARRAELAAIWAPRGDDGDHLDLRTIELGGGDRATTTTAIAVASVRALDGATHETYQLHWNDGATQVAVVCEAAGPADAGPPPCQATAEAALAAFLARL